MSPVKLFVAPRFNEKKDDIRLIRTFNAAKTQELLYKNLPKDYAFTGCVFVDRVEDADYVLIPQSLRKDSPAWRSYFAERKQFANAHGKQIILFIGTDLSHRMHVDGAIVFKGSAYAHDLHPNEIVFVPYAEDLSESVSFAPRKKSGKPTVSFCGYAGFPDWKTRTKYILKNTVLDCASLFVRNSPLQVFKRGIYFRRKSIQVLNNSEKVVSNFIIRDSFAGNSKTIRIDAEEARREYIDNMVNADFVLCPKGDGNYSVRFYEALSLGRIPILIDTDMRLPLEKTIDYSKCILRVPHTEIHHLGDFVADFYESLTDEQFQAMQVAAREAFKTHLRYDSYFNVALPLLKNGGIQALH